MTDCTTFVGFDQSVTFIVDDRSVSVGFPQPVGEVAWTKDEFIPTTGQVTFVLSQTPFDLASLELAVNGVEYDDGVDYTISGATITWLDPFTLKTKDKMIVQYK